MQFDISSTISDLLSVQADLDQFVSNNPGLNNSVAPIRNQIPPLIVQLMDLQTTVIPGIQTQVVSDVVIPVCCCVCLCDCVCVCVAKSI